MKVLKLFVIVAMMMAMQSFTQSKEGNAEGIDLSRYRYVVFGDKIVGDEALDDVIMEMRDAISATRLAVVSEEEGKAKIKNGEPVLTPHIHVATEKTDGGNTYITVNFCEYDTRRRVAIVQGSGKGFTVSQKQKSACNSVRKKLAKLFGSR